MKGPAADRQASDKGPPYFGASQPASIIPSAFLLCTLPMESRVRLPRLLVSMNDDPVVVLGKNKGLDLEHNSMIEY